jgi:hypothetical protein
MRHVTQRKSLTSIHGQMEREDKSKKVVKEKRSVKKTKVPTELADTKPVVAEEEKASTRKKVASPPATMKENIIEAPSIEQIQLRAYFISERRMRLGNAGNSTSDWIQAERELKEEAK